MVTWQNLAVKDCICLCRSRLSHRATDLYRLWQCDIPLLEWMWVCTAGQNCHGCHLDSTSMCVAIDLMSDPQHKVTLSVHPNTATACLFLSHRTAISGQLELFHVQNCFYFAATDQPHKSQCLQQQIHWDTHTKQQQQKCCIFTCLNLHLIFTFTILNNNSEFECVCSEIQIWLHRITLQPVYPLVYRIGIILTVSAFENTWSSQSGLSTWIWLQTVTVPIESWHAHLRMLKR